MKKIIASAMAFTMLCTTAFAAPTKNKFYNKNTFGRDMLAWTASKFAKDTKTDNIPDSGSNDNKNDAENNGNTTKPDSGNRLTMADVVGGICVVGSVIRTTVGGEDAVKVTYYVNGSETARECYFVSSSRTNGKYKYEDITSGSLIYVSLRPDATVGKYAVMSVIGSNGLPIVDSAAFRANFSSGKANFEFSYIADIRTRNGATVVTTGSDEALVTDKNTFCYTFDNSVRNPGVVVGDFMSGDVDSARYDESSGKSTVYFIYAVIYDGETKAICSFAKPITVDGNAEI